MFITHDNLTAALSHALLEAKQRVEREAVYNRPLGYEHLSVKLLPL